MAWNKADSMALASTVALVLTALLGLHGAQAAQMHAAIVNGVVAITSLVSAGVVVWKYLHGVHGITMSQVDAAVMQMMRDVETPPAADEPPPEGHTVVDL